MLDNFYTLPEDIRLSKGNEFCLTMATIMVEGLQNGQVIAQNVDEHDEVVLAMFLVGLCKHYAPNANDDQINAWVHGIIYMMRPHKKSRNPVGQKMIDLLESFK